MRTESRRRCSSRRTRRRVPSFAELRLPPGNKLGTRPSRAQRSSSPASATSRRISANAPEAIHPPRGPGPRASRGRTCAAAERRNRRRTIPRTSRRHGSGIQRPWRRSTIGRWTDADFAKALTVTKTASENCADLVAIARSNEPQTTTAACTNTAFSRSISQAAVRGVPPSGLEPETR